MHSVDISLRVCNVAKCTLALQYYELTHILGALHCGVLPREYGTTHVTDYTSTNIVLNYIHNHFENHVKTSKLFNLVEIVQKKPGSGVNSAQFHNITLNKMTIKLIYHS